MPTLKLALAGSHQPADALRLMNAYSGEPGVYSAIVNGGGHCLEIDFEDDEVTPARLIEIARAEGFEAILAS